MDNQIKELEALRKENAELKADIRTIKTKVLTITDNLGISENGVFNKEIGMSEVFGCIKPLLMPLMVGNMKPIQAKLGDIQALFPIILKYKDL